MKLTLQERFAVLKILPTEVNFVTLKIVRDLQDSLSLTEKETKDWEVKSQSLPDGRVTTTWNKAGTEAKAEIKIGEKATDVVVEALEELDKTSKLTSEHFTIYEKFVDKAK